MMVSRSTFLKLSAVAIPVIVGGALFVNSAQLSSSESKPQQPSFTHDPKAGEDIGIPKGNIIPEAEKHEKTIEGILIKNTSDETTEITIKKVLIKDTEENKKFIYDFRNLSCKAPCVSLIEEGQVEANDEEDLYKILTQEINLSSKKETCDFKLKCKVQSLSSRKK